MLLQKNWKGIVLAGGAGTRLYPMTQIVTKQLLSIYDKPMIYYPLSILMLAGIKDILIITTSNDLLLFERLFKDGSSLGLNITYKVQAQPNGIAEAFLIADKFIENTNSVLILGDNLFYGNLNFLRQAMTNNIGATIFGYQVNDPERYGVVEFDKNKKVISLEEKPKHPKSKYAVPGLYCYDKNVLNYVKQLRPSNRGELEITDLNRVYCQKNLLNIEVLGRGIAWLDTGTPQSLLEASNFVAAVENRQGLKIGCLEEIAYRMGFISIEKLLKLIEPIKNSHYGKYLNNLLDEHDNDLGVNYV